MFMKTNHTLFLVLCVILFLSGCKTHIYSLDACSNMVEVKLSQNGNTITKTPTAVDGNIQFEIRSPFIDGEPMNIQMRVMSVHNTSECKGNESGILAKRFTFNGVVPILPVGEHLLDADTDFTVN
ncbi:MAG: hypothetical protein ACQ9MH_10665 [Nitrospinales bacterium]